MIEAVSPIKLTALAKALAGILLGADGDAYAGSDHLLVVREAANTTQNLFAENPDVGNLAAMQWTLAAGSESILLGIRGQNHVNGKLAYLLAGGADTPLALFAGNAERLRIGAAAADVTLGAGCSLVTPALAAEPAAPPAGSIRLYGKDIAGHVMPKWIDPDGMDYPIQEHLGFNYVSMIGPSAGSSALTVFGNTITTVGTVSHPTITPTTRLNATRRSRITSATTAGSLSSNRVGASEVIRGNAAGIGGFFFVCRFGLGVLQSGNRAFFGLTDTATTAPTNIDPTTSTTPGKVGMAINANSGNWKLVNNITGAAPTVLDLGTDFSVNLSDLLELVLHCKPNDDGIGYRVKNLSTGVTVAGKLTTNIPSNTTVLGRTHWMTNNAAAAAVAFDLVKSYISSDI